MRSCSHLFQFAHRVLIAVTSDPQWVALRRRVKDDMVKPANSSTHDDVEIQ
jgi:hypothetical protein